MLKRLAYFITLLLSTGALLGAEPEMKAHFINVGQAASTLLEFPCGAILIDTGAQDDEFVDALGDYLADFFARRRDLNDTLSALVISHPHIDHTRGIKKVFQVCRVARYIDSGFVQGSGKAGPKFVRDQVAAGRLATEIREVKDDEFLALPLPTGLNNASIDNVSCPDCDPRITVLSGGRDNNPGWNDGEFDNLNNHSVVVRVDFGDSAFLFTGDLETPALETLVDDYQGTDLLDVDVFLVSHHGSGNGTTGEFVSAMTPDVAVLGVGESSFGKGRKRGFNTFSYGHPRRAVIDLLSAAITGKRSRAIDADVADSARHFSRFHVTKKIYATGWDGTVTITAKLDGSMRVTTEVVESVAATSHAGGESALAAIDEDGSSDSVEASPVLFTSTAGDDSTESSEPYHWNLTIPEKRPAGSGNGKVILFDVSHGGTAGQSDWVINGGFSDFADALVDAGYTVREYRGVDKNGDGIIRYFDDRRLDFAGQNEAVIELGAINSADVFVMAETNRPITKQERSALLQFVASGKGLFFIADHYNADRNLNSWDATEVFNGYNRSTALQFDLGGLYGDMRNPGDAAKGWLAENFGLRFRFNTVDCKAGASDILPLEATERLTKSVEPILIAAGATLAIVDPDKAKGLVYLASSDRVTGWQSAIEGEGSGLYFGGRNEGPVVAISKPNRGKAAFIGDSSPIEDSSARYLNELDGRPKRLHNGWNDDGSAADLCLNIVRWLSMPEPYIGFKASEGHPPGIATPNAMADIEQDDPADGEPWRRPQDNYNPWNTDTFRPGSFGAPFPAGSSHAPVDGPVETVSVARALASPEGQRLKVEGVIVDELNDEYGLKLADGAMSEKFLCVQLPKQMRAQFSPKLNPAIRGQRVRVTAIRSKYTGLPGLRNVKSIDPVDGT